MKETQVLCILRHFITR